ncbi:MAG TPA: MOSC domain-containing protein [Rhodobacteraceae bacterium]|nr:MOSC domain-containing protein [Paracoccaceae bacterium]
MTGRLTHIWRHPIKAHGVEALQSVDLETGKTLPWDRAWAVVHKLSQADGAEWVSCGNFSRGAKAPSLMALKAVLDEATGQIAMTHPDLPDITFNPDTESEAFIDWVHPIMPSERTPSARIVRAMARGMTDTDFPSISLNNLATNRALGEKMGTDLSPLRWRGNLWFDGLKPWEEFDWVGKQLRLGGAVLEIRERITRCMATTVNPDTGERDAATLDALQDNWGHKQFGVYGVVVKDGQIALGDKIEVL